MYNKQEELYYKEELRYLEQAGKAFSERHQDIAGFLGLDGADPNLRDPHTERIIESFAFMTGRLRRFLETQYSELTHALFNLICPLYLRPLPSKCILNFTPQESMLNGATLIPRGTLIQTRTTPGEPKPYTFSTCHDIHVQPIHLEKVHIDPETRADFSLSLNFKLHAVNKLEDCRLDDMEIYLHGNPRERFELFHLLSECLRSIKVKGIGHAPLEIEWTGFRDDHALLPGDSSSHTQLYFLRDYFDFPERFGFFRLKGLANALAGQEDLNQFQIDFIFTQPLSSGSDFDQHHFRLNCCPAQNLFLKACEPFKVNEDQFEFPIIADLDQGHYEIHNVDTVLATHEQKIKEINPYYLLNSHTPDQRWFFTLRRELAGMGGWNTYMRLIDLDDNGPSPLQDQQISVKAWCTNRDRAQSLKIGDLTQKGHGIPEPISVTNITQTTKASWPDLYSEREWDFLSHLSQNYREIADLDHLRKLLELYNAGHSELGMRKITGLQSVTDTKHHLIFYGQTVFGRRIEITCNEGHFQHLGDLALFTQVLGRFTHGYCAINSFIELVIKGRNLTRDYTYRTMK